MKSLLIAALAVALLSTPTFAQQKGKTENVELKGPGGKVCQAHNSCACRQSLAACISCGAAQYGLEAQTNWCKIQNPALR